MTTHRGPAHTSLPGRFLRGALWVAGRGLLATMAGDVGGRSCTDSELLLHPELLSQEFLLLTLEQVGRRAAGLVGGGARTEPAQVSSPADTPATVLLRPVRATLRTDRPGLPTPPSGNGTSLAYQECLGIRPYLFGFWMARLEEPRATPAACMEAGREGRGRIAQGK